MTATIPASAGLRPAPPLRVASVPRSHVYVRHLSLSEDDGVIRLPDPAAVGASSPASPWWPPRMLDPEWVDRHASEFDLMHVHFGFDACSPQQLNALVDVLRRHRRPLVFTVHDLRNPHHAQPGEHDAQLDVLVPAADAVITLTDGAAAEIARRWDRDAIVIPHPHVVDAETMRALQDRRAVEPRRQRRIGVHAKSLRACMDPGLLLPVLDEVAGEHPRTVLQVNVHHDIADPASRTHDAELMTTIASLQHADLRVHDFLPDDALWSYLASLDVSVLPYRFGTHSGWLEACRDLGTAVVAPSCGYYADQGPVETFQLDEHAFDPDSLKNAVRRAVRRAPAPASPAFRRAQRGRIAQAHRAVYAAVLGR